MLSPDDDYDDLTDIEYDSIFSQLLTERWLMEILLWPPKAPRPHLIDKLTWMAHSRAALDMVLAALEQDGLIQRDGDTVSATKAAVSLRRLDLRPPEPP